MLTRDAILAAADVSTIRVAVPEWGGDVCVRTFDGAARDTIEQHIMRDGERANTSGLRALVVALACCDESGKVIFTLEDVAALEKKSAAALDRVFSAASKLNKLNDDGKQRGKIFPVPRKRLWFRLAWQFGLPVAELRRRMTSAEFSEWAAFITIEPDIGTRADHLAATLAAFIGRLEATMGGRPPPLKGRLIEWDKRQKDDEQALEQALAIRLAKANGE